MSLQTTSQTALPTGNVLSHLKTDSIVRETPDLQAHVKILAMLPESEAPVLSCCLDLEADRDRSTLERRLKLLRRITPSDEQPFLDEAEARIRSFLETELRRGARGAAIFARGGRSPYFCGLQFEVTTPTRVSLDTVPNIYQLIELKDRFDRYLVLLSTSDNARIFEVHLGSVTRELWLRQPELRRRVGREWTRLQYQNHRRDRDRSFIKEKIQTLERLMTGKGYAHLVLAGDPQRSAMIRRELPKKLQDKVVDIVAAPVGLNEKEVVSATLSSFIEEEEREARSLVRSLLREISRDGLAVCGASNSLQVLRRGQADALLLDKDWEPPKAWSCTACIWSAAGGIRPDLCAECGCDDLREHDAREELVRLAEQTGCHVEIVNASSELRELDGVGCLLRYSEWGTSAPLAA